MRHERRQYARIETDLSCTASTETETFSCRAREISPAGALLFCEPGAAIVESTKPLQIEVVDASSAISVSISGQPVWAGHRGKDACIGVSFADIEESNRRGLMSLLDALTLGDGVDGRRHCRVYHRLPVQFRTGPDAVEGIMNNISCGGFEVASDQPGAVNEELTVEIPFGARPFQFSGKVVYLRTTNANQLRYHRGVRFTAPEVDLAGIQELILFLLHRGLNDRRYGHGHGH